MGSRRRNLFILLFVAGLLTASIVTILSTETKLGLDLSGGTELVYEGRPTPQNPEVTPEDMDRAIEIIRDRTDSLGVSEPEIARIGQTQVSVGLPDVDNAERAIAQVGTTAQMYFYDWEPNVIGAPNEEDPPESPFPRLWDAVQLASQQPPECFEDECTTSGPRFYLFNKRSQQPVIDPTTGEPVPPEGTREDLFLNLPGETQPPGTVVVEVPQGTLVIKAEQNTDDEPEAWFVIHDRPELSGTDISNPEQQFDQTTNQPNVVFDFNGDGQDKFQEVTRTIAQRGLAQHLPGNPVDADSDHFAVVLDNEIVSRPIIDFQENPDGIDGRTGAQISGNFELQEAQDLAEFLKIGALPVELKLISQSTVSATLGEEALDQGLKAGIAGLIIVLLFLILYYRFLGFVAGLGLLVYSAFFYALINLIPITMTLPGIAGLILTIGVAADSNIIIFERIKEEARAGKSMASAIATGYRKGIGTIIDANVITLITAFILFVLATSGVKGFAFTLGVGTIVSLFTAVVFTQAFLGVFGRAQFLRSPAVLGASPEQRVRWHFDFIGASKWFFSMSGVILAVGAISLATLQLNLGIDFESGTRIKVALTESANVDDVRSALDGPGLAGAEIQEIDNPEFGENAFQIQSDIEPEKVPQVEAALDSEFGLAENGFDSQSIGPTFGEQVAKSAVYALIFSLLVISAYMGFRFEGKYAVPVLIAVAHDILITGGVYSLSEREVTSGTVAAFLTILGYSLYDTVIVFDRIRENVPRLPRATFSQVVNKSMSEVLTRSLITGLSTVFLVAVLLVFGGETLKDFAFAMMIGILSGTYSSIFIASPVLTAWKEREPNYRRRRERIESQMGYVPAFPEDNVIARLEDEPEDGEPADDEPKVADDAVEIDDLEGRPDFEQKPAAAPPIQAPEPKQAPEPVATSTDGGDGQGQAAPDGGSKPPAADKPELSDASAAALERMKQERSGGKGRRKRKHGRNR